MVEWLDVAVRGELADIGRADGFSPTVDGLDCAARGDTDAVDRTWANERLRMNRTRGA